MSDTEGTPGGPRRSQRDRKQAKQFVSAGGSQKRKRDDSDTDDDLLSEPEERESVHDADEEEDFSAPKPKAKASTSTAKRGRPKGGASIAKRTRPTKAAPKKAGSTTARRAKKTQATDDAFDPDKIAQEAKISTDNTLFNAIMNPSSALQSTVEDFLESMSQSPEAAQAELVNCILRSCGCNDTVNSDETIDYDGVVDKLDYFTEALKQTWVVAMSSSQLRSFRHTATVIAMEVETALCDVAAAVEKEAEVISRQREGERKRKAGNKGKGLSAREKELEGKAKEVRERRTQLAEFLKEFVDGVFVHRYRDLDPSIRSECVHSLGDWFKKYPAHFLDGTYLRYVGWVLSDSNTHVRLEAVKALSGVYKQADYIGSLSNFTARFRDRFVQMATGDTDLAVRVGMIAVLGSIDEHGLLDEAKRERLCLLVFDEEVKVRRAVSGFVRGVWEDLSKERLVGRDVGSQDKDRAGVKALGMLLVRLAKALDKLVGTAGEEDTDSDGLAGPAESSSRPRRVKEIAALVGAQQRGRIALAVEALWDEIEPVRDWDALLDILLLDHSASDGGQVSTARSRRGKGKETNGDVVVDEAWRLEEVEEAVLLEVLVASLRKAKADAASTHAKKGEEDTVSSDITRALIKGLPRLFVKHQTDEKRIAEVLLIPQLMSLDLYLEMRMIPAYSNLWDDVLKQFSTHSSLTVLSNAVATIRHFMDASSLSNTNSTKIVELEDELAASLREAIAGRDELEFASFTEDEVILLGSLCARLSALTGVRDMTSWMEEDEGGKQSSGWDIISALADRGKLGYKEEELAEIDRYADELAAENAEDEDAEDEHEGKEDEGGNSNSDNAEEAAKAKKQKLEKPKKIAEANGQRSVAQRAISRSRLEREYVFMGVISTFLRAIRAGAVNIRHSSVLLAHHGRLGPAFDLCSKVVVDILREEGMYNNHGDVVVAVVTKALQESFTLFLDGVVSSEAPSVTLAKLQHVVDIHTTSLTWLGERLATYERNKNKKARNKAILFFKLLRPLVAPVENRDVLRIKAHMDQVLALAKVEVSPTSAAWEPQRSYEKRLNTAMSKKGASIRAKGRTKAGKSKEVVTTDDEQGETTGEEQEPDEAPSRSRPKPRPAYRTRRNASVPPDDVPQETDEEAAPKGGEASEREDEPSPANPPSAHSSPITPISPPEQEDEDEDIAMTPKASRKRGRAEEEDQEEQEVTNGRVDESSAAASPDRLASPAGSVGEIKIRRKRARR
ncbi:hypothetical protein EWM64_g3756 [Hericium alpestre]|uniref:SCD domain-containing protein n=1 Tax=Hericium alpestre TaxID=135208 RepID=A0A4Z0A3I3_9AGAM|nr:hypothetical protein EWM64_g3756 [Hericium alpestre]